MRQLALPAAELAADEFRKLSDSDVDVPVAPHEQLLKSHPRAIEVFLNGLNEKNDVNGPPFEIGGQTGIKTEI